jgi:hypothetical protein
MTNHKRLQRYSISVSAKTYDRVRAAVPGSLAGFVDDLMTRTLDDPMALAQLVAKCQQRKDAEA